LFLSKETIYFTGVRAGQSIDVILIPYIELTLTYLKLVKGERNGK